MSLKGFYCPEDGKPKEFDYCMGVCGQCEDLPYLIAISSDLREVVPREFSTTTIEKPVLQNFLMRNFDYYIHPQDMAIVTFGTAMHALIVEKSRRTLADLGYNFRFEDELHFRDLIWLEGIGPTYITGTPDQYNYDTDVMTDFKSLKYYYDVKYLKEGKWDKELKFIRQTNVYRRHKFPNCKKIVLWCFVKDITQDLKEQGVSPIEKFDVPFMKDEEVDLYVRTQLTVHATAEKTGECPPCTEDERFYNQRKNVYQNCAHYCSARNICPLNPYAVTREKFVPSRPDVPELKIIGVSDDAAVPGTSPQVPK
jgi:hypothetical protein